ncbi:MAG: calcium-binding protein [Aestuariivirga sp.]
MAVTYFYDFVSAGSSFATSVFNGSNTTPELLALGADQYVMAANNSGSIDIEYYDGASSTGGATVLDIPGINAATTQLSDGNIVIAKQEGLSGVSYAIYDETGAVVTACTLLGDAATLNPALATLSSGFAIVYEDVVAINDADIEISFRDLTGNSTGSLVVDSTGAIDRNPSVAYSHLGNIAVAWKRSVGGATELWYAIYTEAGGLVTGPTLLDNTGTINRDANLVALADGSFAVFYEDNEYGGDIDIAGAHISTTGVVTGRIDITRDAVENRNPDAVRIMDDLVVISATQDDGVNQDVQVWMYNPIGRTIGPNTLVSGSGGGDDSSIAGVVQSGTFGVAYDVASASTVDAQKLQLRRLSFGDAADDTIAGDDLFDIIDGGDGVDTLTGNGGNDTLDGQAGEDTMIGGTGNDVYVVDEVYDATIEAAGEGYDTVNATITHALRVNIESLALQGTANINGTGNTLDNNITGNAGNNILNGLAGVDTMLGGQGNDTYYYDNAGDLALENSGEGIDIVRSSVSTGLQLEIEKLYITGTATNATGNNLSNYIYGNANANVLNGSDGADRIYGYEGDDIYFVDSSGDLIFETIAGAAGGTDEVRSEVNHTLAANVESLRLSLSGNVNATGNSLANVITGNGGNNYIYGREGNDALTGGLGIDQFVFDRAIGPLNVDTITDFNVADDFLRLDDAIFTAISTGYLAGSAFATGAAAGDADDRIIYDSVTGAVFYDSDGTGAAAQIQFATLSAGLALAASDIYVF